MNRIAAGEVVERPASVVKELVENALDADATRITVEIEDGGRSLIRVIDDGGGIAPEELPLAFAQHATSKIRTDAELHAVSTMGFRGEALASIGSVSRSRILSRRGERTAYEIRNEGGVVSDVCPAAGNAGTTVEVANLFFNTPARRKFLKTAAAESGQVTDVLTRLALARPTVHVRYLRDGKLAADWPAMAAMDRLTVGWPAEYRERSLPIDVRDDDWRLWGVIGLPEYAAMTTRYQHFYVNGRGVRDRSVQHALREAYRGLTEPGRQPAAVLLLEVPAGAVDVNVHPTKSEVRFREPNRVWGLVNSSVRETLLAHDLRPLARPRVDDLPPLPDRPDVRETLADFFKSKLDHVQRSLLDSSSHTSRAVSLHDAGNSFDGDDTGEGSSIAPASGGDAAFSEQSGVVRALQLHNSYLVVQSDDGMEIIDQHALHERVLFEELLERVRRGPLESQRLLMPATAHAPEAQVALLEDLAAIFGKLGIEADAFGPQTIAVHAFPSLVMDRSSIDPAEFVRQVLERAEADAEGHAASDESIMHKVLDMMACKAAVKAGDALAQTEVDALVARRHLTPRASNCPHGRPTTLKLSLGDLERQFKRTGF